ncbi:MAG: hypothetical protein IKK91_09355 [Ruminococcus sp.]|nr:hypothetical protein [Ruminococcus sp.]
MFWKKKKDGYEGYNGGDYIRPNEEYRSDGDEYRADIEEYNNHGQERAEEIVFEYESDVEEFIKPHLGIDEKILWCGMPEKDATNQEKKQTGALAWFGLVFMVVLVIIFFKIHLFCGVVLIAFCIILYILKKNPCYAITDRRVFVFKYRMLYKIEQYYIYDIEYWQSERGVGYVTFYAKDVKDPYYAARNRDRRIDINGEGFFGIRDAEKVAELLKRETSKYKVKLPKYR